MPAGVGPIHRPAAGPTKCVRIEARDRTDRHRAAGIPPAGRSAAGYAGAVRVRPDRHLGALLELAIGRDERRASGARHRLIVLKKPWIRHRRTAANVTRELFHCATCDSAAHGSARHQAIGSDQQLEHYPKRRAPALSRELPLTSKMSALIVPRTVRFARRPSGRHTRSMLHCRKCTPKHATETRSRTGKSRRSTSRPR